MKQKKEELKEKWEEFVADFETTVYKGQTRTDVWAAALINLDDPDEQEYVKIMPTISTFMWHITEIARNCNIKCYFHNLRFDGSFILNFLKNSKYWKEDSYELHEGGVNCGPVFNEEAHKLRNWHYRYAISEKNQWYTITLKVYNHLIIFQDSLKLLPFSVKKMGEDFDLKHKKLEMEYDNHKDGCEITPEERKYICNDVLVVKEALNFMKGQGHDGLTIGACCLKEFKRGFKKKDYIKLFPNLYNFQIPGLDAPNVGEYIRKTYRGGWCYVKPEYAGKEFIKGKDGFEMGVTADVNSLYPSMMESESGNRYCVGLPQYWKGNYIPEEATIKDRYFFIHVKTRFYIKKDMLPTIQIKGSMWYPSREWLLNSDVVDMRLPKSERYKYENRKRYKIEGGRVVPALADLYLTQTDWELMNKHYNLEDTEIIDGMYFETMTGLFDAYIKKYAEIKITAKTKCLRILSKLFLNNLYGKEAASPDSSYRMMFLNDKKQLRGYVVNGYDKTPGYIPIGSQITAYARRFTITACQQNYKYFVYSDTDSGHFICRPDQLVGIPVHKTAFNHWKLETYWDYAKFIRAKTYVEHVTHEDGEKVENPFYNLKCAGMSDHVKELFLHSVNQDITKKEFDKLDKDEQEFVSVKRSINDFKIGLEIPGMLKAKNIEGGTLLVKSNYRMRNSIGD